MIQTFQVRIKLYLLRDIEWKKASKTISRFIDMGLCKREELLEFHNENSFKYYSFDQFYPLENDKIYKKDKIYTVTIRTIIPKLAEFFSEELVHMYNRDIKAITTDIKIIPKKRIQELYSLTPVLVKDPFNRGYWRSYMSIEEFENLLKVNLIKKWNDFFGEKLDENFTLHDKLIFLNKKPISLEYKNINLLGDRIKLYISDNETAEKLAYFALGTGLLNGNSRGFGFVNFK